MEVEELKNVEEYDTIEPVVYTVADIQKILKIGRDSAYELVKEDLFPSIKIKNQYRIPKDSFLEWLNRPSSIK